MKNKYQWTYFSLALLCLICANSQLIAQEIEGDISFAFTDNCSLSPEGGISLRIIPSEFIDGPYEFYWTNINGQQIFANSEDPIIGTSSIKNLSAGEYCVTVTSANGCTASGCGLFIDDCLEAEFSYEVDAENENCGINFFNKSMGDPDSFLWDFGDGNTSIEENPTHIYQEPGNYTVTLTIMIGTDEESIFTLMIEVMDCQGCQVITINPSDPRIGNASSCDLSDGYIEYYFAAPPTIFGGTAPYTWNWSTGASGTFLTGIYNLSSGIYTLTITDAIGCTTEYLHQVSSDGEDIVAAIYPIINASEGCNGELNVIIIDGEPPYALTLEGEGNTVTAQGSGETFAFTGLCLGDYNITISDNGGCETYLDGIIEGCPEITANDPMIISSKGCREGSGSIQFNNGDITGGVSPYSFSWNTGATTPNITELTPGTYTLTVSDANGCTGEFSYIVGVGVPQNGSAWSDLEVTNIVNDATGGCNGTGNCSGSVSVLYSFFGSADFVVELTGNGQNQQIYFPYTGPVQQLYDQTYTFDNLCEGNYLIKSYWRGGCTIETTVTITSEPAFELVGSPQIVKPSNCNATNGSILVDEPSGGTAPYLWVWSNGENIPNGIDNLAPDNYSVTVVDANGCMLVENFDLTVPNEANQVTYTTEQPNGELCDGSVTITGVAGMQLTLNGGNTVTMTGTTYTFSDLCELENNDDYSLLVVDGAGCTNTLTFNLTSCPTLSFSASIFQKPSTCKSEDGTIRILGGPGGGTAPYQFSLFLLNEDGSMTEIINNNCPIGWCNLPEGKYVVEVKDDAGCYGLFTYELVSLATPMVLGVDIKRECEDLCNGYIALAILGGSGDYIHEVTFLGNDGDSEPCLNWEVGETMTFTSETVLEDLINLEWGNYQIITTDAKTECRIEENYFVGEIPSTGEFMVANIDITTSCPEQPTGEITFEISGGFPPYTVILENGLSASSAGEISPAFITFDELPQGGYNVFGIKDRPECNQMISYDDKIEIPAFPLIEFSFNMEERCPGQSYIDYRLNGGVPPFDLTWTGPNTNESLTGILQNTPQILDGLYEGNYSIIVTDAEGCTKEWNVNVTDYDPLVVSSNEIYGFACSDYVDNLGNNPGLIGRIGISITTDPQNPDFQIAWSNGETGTTIDALSPGTYSVTVTNGCTGDPDFTHIESFTIDNLDITEEDVSGENCFNYILCGGVPISIDWSGYEIDRTEIDNNGNCEVTLRCGNGNTVIRSGSETIVGFNGGGGSTGPCFCDTEFECIINESLTMVATVSHPDGSLITELTLGFDDESNVTINESGEYIQSTDESLVVASSMIGGSCSSTQLAEVLDCGTGSLADLAVCTTCTPCMPTGATFDGTGSCMVTVSCGSTSMMLSGTSFESFASATNLSSFACCHDGVGCVRTRTCVSGGFTHSVQDLLTEVTKEIVEGSNPPQCIQCDANHPNSCKFIYRCPGDNLIIHEWCELDGESDLDCNGPIPCSSPNLLPLVTSDTIITNNTITYTASREILSDNDFRILKLYPNPFKEQINLDIQITHEDEYFIQVFNQQGVMVKELKQKASLGKNSVNISFETELPKGVYLLRVYDNFKNMYSTKIIH